MGQLTFLDYDKISDTLMYFSEYITLQFCVSLSRKQSKTNKVLRFHSEYKYRNNDDGRDCYSIKRNFNAYFILNDSRDYNNSFVIRTQDIVLLQMVMQNNIIPWFIGNKRIFGLDDKHNIIIKGKYSPVDFPISDYKYISFLPIVCVYEDGATKEGIRLVINDSGNFVDIDVNKFMEFYYYICNTDMYTAAVTLLNYVKMSPYGQNMMDIDNPSFGNNRYYEDSYEEWDSHKYRGNSNGQKKENNFFKNL